MAARRSRFRHHQPGHADSTPGNDRHLRKGSARIGIPSEAVYWGASHTHSGPGMGSGWLLRLSPGLTGPLSIHGSWIGFSVHGGSCSKLCPVSIATTTSQAKDMCRNRLVGTKGQIDERVHSLFFKSEDQIIATMGISAHATIVGPSSKAYCGIMPVIGLKGWKKPLAVSPVSGREWVATQQRREKRSMRVPWPTGSGWRRSPCSIRTVPLLHPGPLASS